MIISKPNHYNLNKIMESGQIFRMTQVSSYSYSIIIGNKDLRITESSQGLIINCDENEFNSKYKHYLALDDDYDFIIDELSRAYPDDFSQKAIEYSDGIRILHQDPWEVLITFILSQQNNIPRIAGIVNNLCKELGDIQKNDNGNYFSLFPSAETIISHQACIKNDLRMGFRDKYVISAAEKWIEYKDKLLGDGTWDVKWMYTPKLIEELKSFRGVGDKIANCIALFAFGAFDSFPQDVWIKRIVKERYNGEFPCNRYAGIMQQLIYYYARKEKL